MKVLIISAHPRKASFSYALSNAYKEGAEEADQTVRQLQLADMNFNPNVIFKSPNEQDLEVDILKSQKYISWADHLVFVYPTWWGSMPALMKAFLDRVFTNGFAFEEIEGGTGFGKLLRGKTAQLITTMDTPLWVYKWIYRSPGHRMLSIATLQFCGIDPVRILDFSPMRNSTEEKRRKWLKKTKAKALELKNGHLSNKEVLWKNTKIWLRAIRLQFYIFTALAYTVGALLAVNTGLPFNRPVFWLGLLWMFFLEVATVFINEREDYQSDKKNKYFSPFSGGSRVVVERILTLSQLNKGILTALMLSIFFTCSLFFVSPAPTLTLLIVMSISYVLAIGYTLPPLKLSYRGLGAIDVGLTHSLGVLLCGFVFQGGTWNHNFPWLLSVPLFLSIIPSIILAGIPDREADKAVNKRTMAVRLGNKKSAILAMCITILASITVILWKELEIVPDVFNNFVYGTIAHAFYLCLLLYKYLNKTEPPKRIDGLMALSLSFILWFVLIPFLELI